MNRSLLIVALVVMSAFAACGSGRSEEVIRTGRANADRVIVRVTPGDQYLHDLKVSRLMTVTNPPQMAIWIEDVEGRYLQTLYVSRRVAEQSWRGSPLEGVKRSEISRPSALPVWSHRAGRKAGWQATVTGAEDAVASVDATTGATPKTAYTLEAGLLLPQTPFIVMLEVNSSTDFNEAFPRDARPRDAGYSGGPWGSGQPALVLRAELDPGTSYGPVPLQLAGHSSPDGGDGDLRTDMEGFTTARAILDKVTVEIIPAP